MCAKSECIVMICDMRSVISEFSFIMKEMLLRMCCDITKITENILQKIIFLHSNYIKRLLYHLRILTTALQILMMSAPIPTLSFTVNGPIMEKCVIHTF